MRTDTREVVAPDGACAPQTRPDPTALPAAPVARPLGVHHVRLTVTDLHVSTAFYAAVLGVEPVTDRDGDGSCSFQVGNQRVGLRAAAPSGDCFVATRVGLDHLSFDVGSLEALEAAARRLDASEVTHGALTGVPELGIAIVSLQDPDGINLELTAALPA